MLSCFFVKVVSFNKRDLKKILLFQAAVFLFFFLSGQVSVMKIVGKNTEGYKVGTGIFYFF